MRRPNAAAHLSIHAREVARACPQQRDAMLGHCRVAVTFDDMHLAAMVIQFADIHIACRPRAEKNYVFELRTLLHERARHGWDVCNRNRLAPDDYRVYIVSE